MPDHIRQLKDGTLIAWDDGPKNFKKIQLTDVELQTLPESQLLELMAAMADPSKTKAVEK
jgi:hypothetical protein